MHLTRSAVVDMAPSAPVSLEIHQVAGQVTTMVKNDMMYYQLTNADDDGHESLQFGPIAFIMEQMNIS